MHLHVPQVRGQACLIGIPLIEELRLQYKPNWVQVLNSSTQASKRITQLYRMKTGKKFKSQPDKDSNLKAVVLWLWCTLRSSAGSSLGSEFHSARSRGSCNKLSNSDKRPRPNHSKLFEMKERISSFIILLHQKMFQ